MMSDSRKKRIWAGKAKRDATGVARGYMEGCTGGEGHVWDVPMASLFSRG